MRNQRGSIWGAVIKSNGHKTLYYLFWAEFMGERERIVSEEIKSHSVCQVRAENCNPERELEWRQGGELWEQGRIHWKLFEVRKPGKGC